MSCYDFSCMYIKDTVQILPKTLDFGQFLWSISKRARVPGHVPPDNQLSHIGYSVTVLWSDLNFHVKLCILCLHQFHIRVHKSHWLLLGWTKAISGHIVQNYQHTMSINESSIFERQAKISQSATVDDRETPLFRPPLFSRHFTIISYRRTLARRKVQTDRKRVRQKSLPSHGHGHTSE